MEARAIIAALRDGQGLSPEAARWFARGLADGTVSDAQAGAFAMAVFLRGIGRDGRVALTEAMRDTGKVMAWDLPGPVLDKHSTGGIGDTVSLLLAPVLAACGAFVPMISGRGLGHTGGTLDKMEAIAGYRATPDAAVLRKVVAEVGCAIVGATDDIAPADRRLYGIRDISGTVESIDLITPSILSKKLAAGLEGLVLDVKWGSGAFMKTREGAHDLAQALVGTANGAGCRTVALLSDMNQSLGPAAGNALEVMVALEILTGSAVAPDLWAVTSALGAEALVLGGLAATPDEGRARIDDALESGRAAEVFGRMVAALGGPMDFVERFPDRLPSAPVVVAVPAPAAGVVSGIATEALGQTVVRLGGGRLVGSDKVNPSVGLAGLARIGEPLAAGEPLGFVHAATEAAAARAVAEVQAAYALSEGPVAPPDLIAERLA
jgi:thymidine phosphorylase